MFEMIEMIEMIEMVEMVEMLVVVVPVFVIEGPHSSPTSSCLFSTSAVLLVVLNMLPMPEPHLHFLYWFISIRISVNEDLTLQTCMGQGIKKSTWWHSFVRCDMWIVYH